MVTCGTPLALEVGCLGLWLLLIGLRCRIGQRTPRLPASCTSWGRCALRKHQESQESDGQAGSRCLAIIRRWTSGMGATLKLLVLGTEVTELSLKVIDPGLQVPRGGIVRIVSCL